MNFDDIRHLFTAAAFDDFDGGEAKSPALPEAIVETLKEAAARYVAGCPFKVGDLVTARAGYNMSGAGEPGIVIEVPDSPIRNFDVPAEPSDTGNAAFGRRLDMRIACAGRRGELVGFWVEAWAYEAYEAAEA